MVARKNWFPGVCRHCDMRIAWNEKAREWDRVTPNKTFENARHQFNTCGLSESGWHDPNPKRT